MKKLLLTLALLFLASSLEAAPNTFYVATTGSDSNSCATAQTIGTPKRNIMGASGGLACLVAGNGDTLDIRTGTYNEDLNHNVQAFPAGTSYVNAATIKAHTGESVVIRSMNVVLTSQYIIFDHLIVDGALCGTGCNELVSVGAGAHHIRLLDMEIKGNQAGQLMQINPSGSFVEVIRPNFHDSGGVAPGITPSGGYCIYISGDDNLVEYGEFFNCIGYGVHIYHAGGGNASRNTIRYNRIHGMVGGGTFTTGSGLLLGTGDSNQAYGNIIYGNTGNGCELSNNATNSKFFNNTVFDNNTSGVNYGGCVYGTGSNLTIKNNIFYQNTSGDLVDSNGVLTPTFGGNFCTNAGTGCAVNGNPLFVASGSANFSLQVGSPAINIGTAAIASGITACANGSAPDAGAIETLGTPTATVNGTALVITVPNNCTSQMLPATGVTGFTAKKNGSGNTITANVRSGSNSFAATLTSAFVGGDTLLFSYAQTGNATADNNIGNVTTSNQEILAFTDVAGVNITAGAGGSVGLSHWRVYLLQGATDTAWTAKCAEDSTNCTVAPGSKLWVRFKLRNNSGSNYSPFNFVPRWRYNGGSYVTLTNANYVNAIKVVGTSTQLGTVLSDSTTLTQDQLTSNQTNIACQAIRSSGAFPSLTLNDATETECAQAVDISTAAVAGDTYEGCPYDDIGTALTCSTPVKLTVGSYASAR